jgi:uncharacterized protein
VSAHAGPSHAFISSLIDKVCERATAREIAPRIGQRAERDNPHLHSAARALDVDQLEKGVRDGALDLVAGTPWLWAREQLASSVDVLFIDEAGQLSLADVLAVAHAAGRSCCSATPSSSRSRAGRRPAQVPVA